MKTNDCYCLCLTNAQGLGPLNGNDSFFFSCIKKGIIYLRRSGLFLSSLSHLEDQKWALISRHRLREFKHQLSSIMSKPSGTSESAEIHCYSELMKSVSSTSVPLTLYERQGMLWSMWCMLSRPELMALPPMSSESSLWGCENHLESQT